MHDQDIRALRELDELWIGSVLIGAEDDGHIARLHPVRQSWKRVRYSQRGHGHSIAVEHRRGLRLGHVDDADFERYASPQTDLGATHGRTQHLKRARFLVEKATEKRRKVWRHVVAGGTDDR